MLIELHKKGGTLCQPAKLGHLHCPLLVRPTSEDNVTGHVVHTLRSLNPRLWLSDFLNGAVGWDRFPRQVYRRFRLEPWVRKSPFPSDLLPWKEGGTQVDLELSWENPPTTVYIECKYSSPLSLKTAQNDGSGDFPGDQLVRNIRVGLLECGYYPSNALFKDGLRDFVVVVMAPTVGQPLVREYRDLSRLKHAIPNSHRITSWPSTPFVGEIGYEGVCEVLQGRKRFCTRTERHLIDALSGYLAFKLATRPNRVRLPEVIESSGNC